MDNFNMQEKTNQEQNQKNWAEGEERASDSFRQDGLFSFPVDLSKEEFIRFNLLVSSVNGILRFRKGQITLFAVMGIITFFMLLSDILVYKAIDPVMVILIVFIAVAGGMMMFGATAHVRRSAERAYEQSRMSGQSYYGIITVYPNRIEKNNSRASVRMNLSHETAYIETRDMMVFLSHQTPAIVIPARCLTAADAEALRQTVLTAIPRTLQKIEGRLVPTATEHITQPDSDADDTEWQDETAIRVEVDYKREEFVRMAGDTALRAFMKILPYYSIMSLLAALMFGLLYNFGVGLVVYAFINAGLFSFQFFGGKAKAGRAYDTMPQRQAHISVLFTGPGIQINAPGSENGVRLTWNAVQRAVERPDDVEFFSQSVFLRIPKRCIEDFHALRAFVDSHYQPKRK